MMEQSTSSTPQFLEVGNLTHAAVLFSQSVKLERVDEPARGIFRFQFSDPQRARQVLLEYQAGTLCGNLSLLMDALNFFRDLISKRRRFESTQPAGAGVPETANTVHGPIKN